MLINVREIKPEEITAAFAERVSHLASQLRGGAIVVTREWLLELTAFPKTWLLIAQVEDEIAGMLTLSAFPRASGWTPWIEGVIAEEAMRGRGIGRALMERAIAICRAEGFETINLSSRPERVAANALYASLGFDKVPTYYRRLQLL